MVTAAERTTSCPTCGRSRYVEVTGKGNKTKGKMYRPHCTEACVT